MKKVTQALSGPWLKFSGRRLPEQSFPNRILRLALVTAGIAAPACATPPAHAGSVSYGYDALGRLATAVYNSGASTTTITYSYDAAGNRSSVATTTP